MAKNSGGTRSLRPKNIKEAVYKKIDSLYKNGFTNENVFMKLKNSKEAMEFRKLKNQIISGKDIWDINNDKVVNEIKKRGHIVNADVNRLISAQDYLNKEQVAKYMSKEDYDGIVGFGLSGTDKVILVDGNHRAAAAKINGMKTVPVKILTISNENLFKATRKAK